MDETPELVQHVAMAIRKANTGRVVGWAHDVHAAYAAIHLVFASLRQCVQRADSGSSWFTAEDFDGWMQDLLECEYEDLPEELR